MGAWCLLALAMSLVDLVWFDMVRGCFLGSSGGFACVVACGD